MNEGYQWCEECKIYYDEKLYNTCPLCYQKSMITRIQFVNKWDRKGDSPSTCVIALILFALLAFFILSQIWTVFP